MSKKGTVIYKLISFLTLALPVPIYLFLVATLFNITPDFIVYTDVENVVVEVIEKEKEKDEQTFFLYTTDNARLDGIVSYRDKYGIEITSENIIKIGKNYYSYTQIENVYQLVDIKKFEIQKQQKNKFPAAFFISLFAVLIVAGIISKKMVWHKKYPRGATLIALLTGTVTIFILDFILGNILGVFIVATISWAIYCLEYMVMNNKLSEKEKEQKESELARMLRGYLNE